MKQVALIKLHEFASQRPRIDIHNYGSCQTYRQEAANVTRQLARFRKLFAAAVAAGLPDAVLIKAGEGYFSGRLTWNGKGWDYCTGQYWPTEFRLAACVVLEAALRNHRKGN